MHVAAAMRMKAALLAFDAQMAAAAKALGVRLGA
jgi:hypothetical protein